MLNFNQTIDTNYPRNKIPMILTMLDLLYVLNLSNGSIFIFFIKILEISL